MYPVLGKCRYYVPEAAARMVTTRLAGKTTFVGLQGVLYALKAMPLAVRPRQEARQRDVHHVCEALRLALGLLDRSQLPQQLPSNALCCPNLCSLPYEQTL